ncbi:MAG: DUF3810 domain-containing protein [Oscillospiraceae bacterium]|nr:DUF3810 domain-containing protein [Oscillospiraceae bacterium]
MVRVGRMQKKARVKRIRKAAPNRLTGTAAKRRVVRVRLVACAIMAAVCLLLVLLRFLPNGAFFKVYTPWSRFISGFVGFLFSFAPFSRGEFVLWGVVLSFVGRLIYVVVLSFRRTDGRQRWPRFLADLLTTAVSLLTAFIVFWGLQYYAPKAEALMRLDIKPRSQQELTDAAIWFARQASAAATLCAADENGALQAGGFRDMARLSADSVAQMKEITGLFVGAIVSPPKRVTGHIFMSYFHIAGIYNPFTGEGNVSPMEADTFLLFSMTHELAHRLGAAPEDDANFLAYLALASSESPEARYSGAVNAFLYCAREIEDPDNAALAWNEMPPMVYEDFKARADMAKKLNLNPKIEEVTSAVGQASNDTYLKTMGQQDGVKSYNRVTDLLLAYYEKTAM